MNELEQNEIKNVLVACGTAIATSTHVSMRIKEEMQKRGLQVNTIQCRIQEVPRYIDSVSVIVATSQVPFNTSIPVINGVPILTGIGAEEVIENIYKALKS